MGRRRPPKQEVPFEQLPAHTQAKIAKSQSRWQEKKAVKEDEKLEKLLRKRKQADLKRHKRMIWQLRK